MHDIREWLANMSPDRLRVTLRKLPQGLARQGDGETLYRLLTDFNFIEVKISHPEFVTQDVIEDYQAALDAGVLFAGEKAETLRLIQGAIRRSAHILEKDKTQLTGQLWGRLLSFDVSEIQKLLEVAKHRQAAPWLRPLTASLIQADKRLIRALTGHTRRVNAVAVTPDGKWVVSGSWDRTIKVWNLATGEQENLLTGHTNGINAVAITPNGEMLISGSIDKTLKVWNLKTGKQLFSFTDDNESVTSVAVTPNGRRVIFGSLDETIKIWNLETKELVKLYGHTGWVTSVAVTPDGKLAISGSTDNSIKVWNLETGKQLDTLTDHTDRVRTVAVSPDGKLVISGSNDKTLKIWNLETKEVFTLYGHTGWVTSVAVTPDGKQVISGSIDKTIKVWDLQTGNEINSLTVHTDIVRCLAVTPDAKQVISGSDDNDLKIWELKIGEQIWKPIVLANKRKCEPFVLDQNRVKFGVFEYEYMNLNLPIGKELNNIVCKAKWVISDLWEVDDKHKVDSSFEYQMKIVDLATGDELNTITSITKWVTTTDITSDGSALISNLIDYTHHQIENIEVNNMETAKPLNAIAKYTKHKSNKLAAYIKFLSSVVFKSDGSQLNSNLISIKSDISNSISEKFQDKNLNTLEQKRFNSNSKSQKRWDAFNYINDINDINETAKPISLEIGNEVNKITSPTASLYPVAVTPDGKRIISASGDKTLKVWDLENQEVIASFTGDSELLYCAIAPDGVTIVAADKFGILHFLRLEGLTQQ